MHYDLPAEIQNSQCWYLNNRDTIIAYPNNRTRKTYIRSGTEWYLQNTQTTNTQYTYDWSGYNCLGRTQLEYEYSYIYLFYYLVAFLIAAAAIFAAYKITIGRLLKGGSKW